MKLPIPFLNNKKESTEFYLALLLVDEKISAVILEEEDGKLKIIGKHQEFFDTSAIEQLSLEELTTLTDKAITKAEEILPPDVETHKTVFGVKQGWVEEETKKIKKEHLGKLKKLCDSLSLSPLGFMVVNEAIAHLLQEEEGAPLSAIFAEIGKKTVSLALLRGGKIVESVDNPLEVSAPATVDALLKHFTVPVLPARIILIHADDGEHLAQQFISFQWSKSLPFLHVPQISILPADFDAKAVTFGAAAQMGFEAAGISKNDVPKEIASLEDSMELSDENGEEEADAEEEKEEQVDNEDEDKKHHTTHHEATMSTASAKEFGFVVNEDITKVSPRVEKRHHEDHVPYQPKPSVHHIKDDFIAAKNNDDFEDEEDEEYEKIKKGKASSLLGFLPTISLPSLFKNFRLPTGMKGRGIYMAVGIFVLLLVVAGGIIYTYLYKSNVVITLSIKPNNISQSADVTFSTDSENDFGNNIIAAKSVSTTIEGELAANATGKKDVGEKAKGSVTIYSRLTQAKTFTSGTVVKGNGLEFTLDKDVKVASSSGDASTNPSTATVAVTAKASGTESNLPSGIKFSIDGFDAADVVAKNESAFSGGTKKTVTVVSKADLDKLRIDLPKTLQEAARNEIAQTAGDNESVLPIITSATITKPVYDKKEGDEAKTVKLKATVEFKSLSYKKSDLDSYSQSLLKSKYAGDTKFADESVKGTVEDPREEDDESISASIKVQGGLLPKIDISNVSQTVQKKSFSDAKKYLLTLPQISGSDIKFSPNIPLLPNIFPRLPQNITITINSHE